MAINLLPEEEKTKIKPEKREAVTHIEMTGPVSAEKKKRTANKSGVLMFVKQAFRQPKQEAVEINFPEPARHKGGVLASQSQKKAIQPRVKVTKPKPEPMRVKSSKTFMQRFVYWVTHIFSGSSKVKPITKAKHITPDVEKAFPKYKPVRAEKQSTSANGKSRQVEVIKVTTKYSKKEAGQGKSFWHPQSKVKIEPTIIETKETPKPPIMPHSKENMDLKKIELVPQKQKQVLPKEISKEPKVHKPRFSFSKWWKDLVDSLKKLLSHQKKEKKETAPESVKVGQHILPPTKPGKPLQKIEIVSSHDRPAKEKEKDESVVLPAPASIEPEKKDEPQTEEVFPKKEEVPVPKPPKPEEKLKKIELVPQKQKQVLPKEISKEPKVHKPRFSFSKWWKDFINSLKKLLSQKKKDKKEAVPEPVKAGPHIIPPAKPGKPLQKIEIVPPPASPKDGIELTEPENGQFSKPGIEWEVNLIPDDALEVKISLSKILILISFIILSVGLVFGGWITANWFYSNITAEISKINREISVAEANISSFQDLVDRVQLLKSDIDEVNTLLNEHVYWDGIFQKLEEYTVPEVYYTSMTADVNGYLSFTAIGKDYDSAIKQLYMFEKASDFIINVSIESVGFIAAEEAVDPENVALDNTERLVGFTIKMAVNPNIFYYPR